MLPIIPKKKTHPEFQYLDLLQKVLTYGKHRNDRTKTGTISLFGERIEFNLDVFPLLTTKKVFWRGIVEELIVVFAWFHKCNRVTKKKYSYLGW